jgi:Arc/MetJ-type ribon-helix-helix transcriptional regulator
MKKSISVTIDENLIKWIEEGIKTKRFASVSHGIEFSISELKKRETKT